MDISESSESVILTAEKLILKLRRKWGFHVLTRCGLVEGKYPPRDQQIGKKQYLEQNILFILFSLSGTENYKSYEATCVLVIN